jgi:hypothetical protein
MRIDKRQLLSALTANGDAHQIGTVERELPDRIDTEEYADALSAFGLSSSELGELGAVGQETGGFGGFGGPGARLRTLGG